MNRKDLVQQFFGANAAAYAVSPGHHNAEDLTRLLTLLAPTGAEVVLDIATATGNSAFALAPFVALVVGVDLTPEMAREFSAQALERGITNAHPAIGDAERLPFADTSVDMVTCRRAAHHFPDVPWALAEMVRLLRRGGKLGIVDMATPDEPMAARLCNQMELARDPSHGRALSTAEWRTAIAAAGLTLQSLEVAIEELDLGRWLAPASPDGREAAEAAALAMAAPAEVSASVVRMGPDGVLRFIKRRVILLAVKP